MDPVFETKSRVVYLLLVFAITALLALMAITAVMEEAYILLPMLAAFPVILFYDCKKIGVRVAFHYFDLIPYIYSILVAYIAISMDMDMFLFLAMLVMAATPLASTRVAFKRRPFKQSHLIGYIVFPVAALWALLVLMEIAEPSFILIDGELEYVSMVYFSIMGLIILSIKKEKAG